MALTGLSNRQIAAALGLSPHTVKDHLSAAYVKLGASSRTHAATIMLRQQLARGTSDGA
jgi:DNA-binding NarL/FixJ family response regulator